MAAKLREHPPPHIQDLQRLAYLLVYNIFTKKERTPKKSQNTPSPFTTYFRNQIPFLWAYPLSKLEVSFRRKKNQKTNNNSSLLIYQRNSSLNFQKRLLQQHNTGLFTLNAKPWYGKEAQLKGYNTEGLYKFFLLLFSISFAYASQNYKILVGEMPSKARFHIPKDLFPCAAYEPVDHPGKPGKHTLAHQCCNCWQAALHCQGFALYFLWEISIKPDKQPNLWMHHL